MLSLKKLSGLLFVVDFTIIHGNAVVINGIGVLITGDSGTGKTRLSLHLLESGHAMIADDAVQLSFFKGQLHACAPDLTYDRLALSRTKFISITETFGQSALVKFHSLSIHAALDHTHQHNQASHLLERLHYVPVNLETRKEPVLFELLIQNRIECLSFKPQEARC